MPHVCVSMFLFKLKSRYCWWHFNPTPIKGICSSQCPIVSHWFEWKVVFWFFYISGGSQIFSAHFMVKPSWVGPQISPGTTLLPMALWSQQVRFRRRSMSLPDGGIQKKRRIGKCCFDPWGKHPHASKKMQNWIYTVILCIHESQGLIQVCETGFEKANIHILLFCSQDVIFVCVRLCVWAFCFHRVFWQRSWIMLNTPQSLVTRPWFVHRVEARRGGKESWLALVWTLGLAILVHKSRHGLESEVSVTSRWWTTVNTCKYNKFHLLADSMEF